MWAPKGGLETGKAGGSHGGELRRGERRLGEEAGGRTPRPGQTAHNDRWVLWGTNSYVTVFSSGRQKEPAVFGRDNWEWRPRDREGRGWGGAAALAASPPPQQGRADSWAFLVVGGSQCS